MEQEIQPYVSEDSLVKLEVRVEEETVWLTQSQIADLFQKDRSVITRHINNIFAEGELEEGSNVHFLHIANADRPTKFYNLDVIISVGYRVKSKRGIQFRRWANHVIKDYVLRGYAVNQRIKQLEESTQKQFVVQNMRIDAMSDKIDSYLQSALPPRQGIFFDGQVFDAHRFVSDLVRTAKQRVVLFDNYVDDTTLAVLDKRQEGVTAVIYTRKITPALGADLRKHDEQYAPIEVREFSHAHDRFLCIDDIVYHLGASLKDLGRKWFAFSRMEVATERLLEAVGAGERGVAGQ